MLKKINPRWNLSLFCRLASSLQSRPPPPSSLDFEGLSSWLCFCRLLLIFRITYSCLHLFAWGCWFSWTTLFLRVFAPSQCHTGGWSTVVDGVTQCLVSVEMQGLMFSFVSTTECHPSRRQICNVCPELFKTHALLWWQSSHVIS